jgi:multidrug efflux pump subunit AcrB
MKDYEPHELPQDAVSRFVKLFLDSNLSAILILFSVLIGIAALWITPREEDPQIVVPLADIYVQYPGHSAAEVEQLISTPLERVLYQIDGVEYVYSMSSENRAVITVRFYVGQDRERSLVKLFKKLDEYRDTIPQGVTQWVIKPVEIDDVPVVTLTLRGKDSYNLRRVGEETIERLAAIPDVSRAYVIGGESRQLQILLNTDNLIASNLSALSVENAIRGANLRLPAGSFNRNDTLIQVDASAALVSVEDLKDLVVGVSDDRPIFLKDVATFQDGPVEPNNYVRHYWGPGRSYVHHDGAPGTVIGVDAHAVTHVAESDQEPYSAVTLALSKKKGANAVAVAERVIKAASDIQRDFLPSDMEMVVTRNYGLTANEKVNELIEALGLAILIVIVLLTFSLGWREAIIVAVAVPVVFGLTLAVNLMFGYTINRVTLFALILSLGLIVDDPIVDVENISRHFAQRKKATRGITLSAVSEIRPPLISATLAVIVSFIPLFFITGMMGPYMAPMALNVPVSMFMSMLVAFTITPWLTFHLLKRHVAQGHVTQGNSGQVNADSALATPAEGVSHELYNPDEVHRTFLYRFFRPLMTPLLASKARVLWFLLAVGILTVAATGLAALRVVPLKMLPFDNKNELLLILDIDEGTTLERSNAIAFEFEEYLRKVPEVTDLTSYVGLSGPIDFNGLVRHYYLRQGSHVADIRVNLVGKKNRKQQSHAIALRIRDDLTQIARRNGVNLKIVELPPGPPVLASVVAEVYGPADMPYDALLNASDLVKDRFAREPGLADVDSIRENNAMKWEFVVDQEKAAIAGVSVEEIAQTLALSVNGSARDSLRLADERQPLYITVKLPLVSRSSLTELGQLQLTSRSGAMVSLAELGHWKESRVDQTIYHKNLQRVVYVFAETVGRPPAECIVDVMADQKPNHDPAAGRPLDVQANARSVAGRTYLNNGSDVAWSVPKGVEVHLAGEGEWKITLDVFRDLGLAFGAAVLMIYVILVAQTGSFLIPGLVMLAIPLTILGVMPGFWLLNVLSGQTVGAYADPAYFTATAMIGMIALSGIVTRDSIILVDFIQLSVQHGRSLFDAILESRVVRLRPILLTAGAAMLGSLPITLDPIFSGLGWSLIFGLFASTVFTLFVIPACYWLLYERKKGKSE